jgi:hypothetical protein
MYLNSIKPAEHWSARYVGLPYAEADCAALAARVQHEVFGRAILLPYQREPGLRGMSAQIERLKADFAKRIEAPIDGDAVLMQSRGRLDHIGIYCIIENEPWVLHSARNAGQAVLHRLRDLGTQGLTLEGYYRWVA